MNDIHLANVPSREQLVHRLCEAAELEHCLMCTYLYAAYSLRQGVDEGLSQEEAAAVKRWYRVILDVAIEEMGHLVAVWNITSALGAFPRIGRVNFPLDPGYLPARLVVKLAPFNDATLQHFIFLERPQGSDEPDGAGFEPERLFARGNPAARLTPMAVDYETVGEFYQTLGQELQAFVTRHGEREAFCGDRGLQIPGDLCGFAQVKPVICLKTALAAFDAIVLQGEGAPADSAVSHYRRFVGVREELAALRRRNPTFVPALPAATNPVLRRPPRPEGRVWLEDSRATETVDLANAGYGLMLRLIALAYSIPDADAEKSLVVDLAIGLMQAFSALAMHAARLPAGPSNPDCNAGVTFATLRDAAPLPLGPSGHRFIVERLAELAEAASRLAGTEPGTRTAEAARILDGLRRRGEAGLSLSASAPARPTITAAPAAVAAPPSTITDGIESVEGRDLTLRFEAKRCIHSRHCVTGAPKVFLANVKGPWLFPDAMPVERLAEIAHACPSGAITYVRKDGAPNEAPPPVNLVSIREAGPYAFHGALVLDGHAIEYRATLCRCGASRNKPFCDSSHVEAKFQASGEPVTGLNGVSTEMPAVRDGPLAIDPQRDGPLVVRGNLEIISGTGRMVGRVTTARFCRCGGSATKPFCDNTHKRIGFKST